MKGAWYRLERLSETPRVVPLPVLLVADHEMKITLDIKPSELSLHECVDLLGRFYSDQDPITWKGEYTTPDGLIDYFGGKKCRLIKNGTLTGMLADRAKCKD
jgi:hypothetical protein